MRSPWSTASPHRALPETFSPCSRRSIPSSPVSIDLASSAPTEGIITSPANGTLLFNSSNWTGQTVTVTGVDDGGMPDGDVMYSIGLAVAESNDDDYDGYDPADVTGLVNVDDDPPPPVD